MATSIPSHGLCGICGQRAPLVSTGDLRGQVLAVHPWAPPIAERADPGPDPREAALRCIGGLACYRDGVDSHITLSGKLNAIAVQVSAALRSLPSPGAPETRLAAIREELEAIYRLGREKHPKTAQGDDGWDFIGSAAARVKLAIRMLGRALSGDETTNSGSEVGSHG